MKELQDSRYRFEIANVEKDGRGSRGRSRSGHCYRVRHFGGVSEFIKESEIGI